MSKSACLRIQDVRAILRLVGECRDLGDDPAAWRLHLFKTLARFTGAALTTGGEVAGVRAGRPTCANVVTWGWENGLNRDAWFEGLANFQSDSSFSLSWSRYAARLRQDDGVALTRKDLVRDEEYEASAEYWAASRPTGVDHTLGCYRSLPGAADVYCGITLWRAAGEPEFTPRDRALVRETYAALAPLIGGPLACPAEPSPSALPPRVRQVLRCLLEGDGDKQIAARLGLTRHTVNQYAKALFRHFGVQSRAELLARWVRRGFPARFAWEDG